MSAEQKVEAILAGTLAFLPKAPPIKPATNGNGRHFEYESVSAQTSGDQRRGVGRNAALRFQTARELAQTEPERPDYVAEPYVVRGAVTNFSSREKVGKTSLLMDLCRAITSGGLFLGRRVVQSSVVYVTEERTPSLRQALERADLLEEDRLHLLTYADSRGIEWVDLIRLAADKALSEGAIPLIVDTAPKLAGLKGDAENDAGTANATMSALEEAASKGLAVVAAFHLPKDGESTRGSTAWDASADMLLRLRKPEGDHRPTVRVLEAIGRFDVPEQVLIERMETGFVCLGNSMQVEAQAIKEALVDRISPDQRYDFKALHQMLPSGTSRSTLQRVLGELVHCGEIQQLGLGRRNDPYTYQFIQGGS